MKRAFYVLLLILVVATAAADRSSNSRLIELYQADQLDRSAGADKVDWSKVAARDAARRAEVKQLLKNGEVHTDSDYYCAAMILQHGDNAEEIRLAHSMATIASYLNPDDRSSRWLIAATWDRLMMHLKRPQWYGTQFVREGDEWILYEVDETAATDEDRKRHGVGSLAESKTRASMGGRN